MTSIHTEQKEDPDTLLGVALFFERSGKLKKAEAELLRILAALEMAKFTYKYGRADEALRLTKKAMEQWSSNIQVKTLYFDILIHQKAYTEALNVVEKWFQETPKHPDIFTRYVNILKILDKEERVNSIQLCHGQENVDMTRRAHMHLNALFSTDISGSLPSFLDLRISIPFQQFHAKPSGRINDLLSNYLLFLNRQMAKVKRILLTGGFPLYWKILPNNCVAVPKI
ncbi:MAG: tetratricopeptide repeat protein [Magnetococcales bacterium]|nr:tetratricopeptide repeat protein [Magnetococcales bacterium]